MVSWHWQDIENKVEGQSKIEGVGRLEMVIGVDMAAVRKSLFGALEGWSRV
jgi:hypothetical protein